MRTLLFTRRLSTIAAVLMMLLNSCVTTKEYQVAKNGSDNNEGTAASPLLTIMAAAELAQPGDVILIHEGVYRERINPPRGGTSDSERITYMANPGDEVIITGAEIVTGWTKDVNDTWMKVIPNTYFGDYNPYKIRIDEYTDDWYKDHGGVNHTGAVYLNGVWNIETNSKEEVQRLVDERPLWYAEVDENNTTIWAQFEGVDPNQNTVEINKRRTVFYPSAEGFDYITVKGFKLRQAATTWSPPTTQQIGLVGPNWSKGWIIEDCEIYYSKCAGVTLGKYNDPGEKQLLASSMNGSERYNATIDLAFAHGWTKENVGSHIVRNNHIHDCEQVGIGGSLGPVFSTITGNTIHDIQRHRKYTGETGGIKLHAPIDVTISNNHIYNTSGIYLDWMIQGTRVTGNVLHNSGGLKLEVSHGPCLIDNNIFLTDVSVFLLARGNAFAHNLIVGRVYLLETKRETPYHATHSTEVLGNLINTSMGDDRYYNNILIGEKANLTMYDTADMPVTMDGNVFLYGAALSDKEENPLVEETYNPNWELIEKEDGLYLKIDLDEAWREMRDRKLITTELLGKTVVTEDRFDAPDGSTIMLDRDYFGNQRNTDNPFPGPFESPWQGEIRIYPK